ncbi:hypothetical protein BLNAU_7698 [Blattamonas nauphoetae]|uniref:Uncharacterized protein n=1 Tax=Blattamonas nauphoetae TaxID=2049346 RepID=A0ABQ9Y0Q8_9EUKA|nr:hypothetical protein BLNAU_7698 [Blattamonas nauphoetae]
MHYSNYGDSDVFDSTLSNEYDEQPHGNALNDTTNSQPEIQYGFDVGYDSTQPYRHRPNPRHQQNYTSTIHSKAPSYRELMNETHTSYDEYRHHKTKPPRPENMRMADTFYQQPRPPTTRPTAQQEFFERSLNQSAIFPLHAERLLGIKRPKKEIVHQAFGDSPLRERRPNYRIPAKRRAATARDYNAFYEGRVTARRAQDQIPGTVFMSPGMDAARPVLDGEERTEPLAMTRTRGRGFDFGGSQPMTRSMDGYGWTSDSVEGMQGVTQEAILYKHKRAYQHEFPPMADRFNPEATARERKMLSTIDPSLRGGAAKARKTAEEAETDKNCTFRPRSLQKATPFYPEYASGKPVSSTYAQYGQVSYMLPDTSAIIKRNTKTANARMRGTESTESRARPRGSVETAQNKYAVTTWSSFSKAAERSMPKEQTKNEVSPVSFGSAKRPPLRIATHPVRY